MHRDLGGRAAGPWVLPVDMPPGRYIQGADHVEWSSWRNLFDRRSYRHAHVWTCGCLFANYVSGKAEDTCHEHPWMPSKHAHRLVDQETKEAGIVPSVCKGVCTCCVLP
jgi:hypothetical protein